MIDVFSLIDNTRGIAKSEDRIGILLNELEQMRADSGDPTGKNESGFTLEFFSAEVQLCALIHDELNLVSTTHIGEPPSGTSLQDCQNRGEWISQARELANTCIIKMRTKEALAYKNEHDDGVRQAAKVLICIPSGSLLDANQHLVS